MPKVNLLKKEAETDLERATRIFRAAIRYSMELRREDVQDVALQARMGSSTLYRRLTDVTHMTDRELLNMRDRLTDRQLCEMFGVQYHGSTRDLEMKEVS